MIIVIMVLIIKNKNIIIKLQVPDETIDVYDNL